MIEASRCAIVKINVPLTIKKINGDEQLMFDTYYYYRQLC